MCPPIPREARCQDTLLSVGDLPSSLPCQKGDTSQLHSVRFLTLWSLFKTGWSCPSQLRGMEKELSGSGLGPGDALSKVLVFKHGCILLYNTIIYILTMAHAWIPPSKTLI